MLVIIVISFSINSNCISIWNHSVVCESLCLSSILHMLPFNGLKMHLYFKKS